MDCLAPIARGFIAPAWAWWERSPYLRHYRRLLYTQFDPPEVIQERQWAKIGQLSTHAYETTPFWQERLDQTGLTPGKIRSPEDFRRVPLLTKHDLRARGKEMLSREYAHAQLHRKKTSGSTGVSVEVWVDEAAQQFQRGAVLRSDEWSGWRLGERVAAV